MAQAMRRFAVQAKLAASRWWMVDGGTDALRECAPHFGLGCVVDRVGFGG